MFAAETLCIEPRGLPKLFGILSQRIIDWRITAAPASVRVVGHGMVIIGGNILADHERFSCTVRYRGYFHGLLKGLTEEEAATASVATAIVLRSPSSWRRVSIIPTPIFRWHLVVESSAAKFICECIVNDALVAC